MPVRSALLTPRDETTHRVASGVHGEYVEAFCLWPVTARGCAICVFSLNENLTVQSIVRFGQQTGPSKCVRVMGPAHVFSAYEGYLRPYPWVVLGRILTASNQTREYHWFSGEVDNGEPRCDCAGTHEWSSERRKAEFLQYLRFIQEDRGAREQRLHLEFVQAERANHELYRSGIYQLSADSYGRLDAARRALAPGLGAVNRRLVETANAMRQLRDNFHALSREEQAQVAQMLGGVPEAPPSPPPSTRRRREQINADGERVYLDE